MAKSNVPAEPERQHIENFKQSVLNATPQETRAGNRWYGEAHRDAVHNSMGIAPGIKVDHPSGNGRQSSPGGLRARVQHRLEHPDFDPATAVRAQREHHGAEVEKAAAEIAATSPASPSGMDWEKNSQAAFEGARMPRKTYEGLQRATAAAGEARTARGRVTYAQNRGQPTKKLQQASDAALENSKATSAREREPLNGRATKFAGNEALSKAYEIHNNKVAPHEALDQTLKTGHFQGAIMGRHDVVADEHMANVLGGRFPWHTNPSERDLPNVSKAPGQEYAGKVIRQGAAELGKDPEKAQAIAWIHEKNVKGAMENGEESRQVKARRTINRNVSARMIESL